MKLKQGLIVSALAASALLVGVVPAVAQTSRPRCMDTVSGTTIRGNVTVPAGEVCVVEDSTITGNVTVGRGSDLYVSNSTVIGNVVAQNDAYVDVFDTTVGGVRLNTAFGLYMDTSAASREVIANDAVFTYLFDSEARSTLRVTGGEAFIGDIPIRGNEPTPPTGTGSGSRVMGDVTTVDTDYTDIFNSVLYSDLSITNADQGSLICTSEIDGLTSLMDNSEILQIGADAPFAGCGYNVMSGDVDIYDNEADIQVAGNTIRGNVNCEGNDPAPVIGANRLRGEGTGQCAPAGDIADSQPNASARVFSNQAEAQAAVDRHAELNAAIDARRAEAGQAAR